MRCREAKRLIERAGRPGTPTVEQQALEAHLVGCDRCREAARAAGLMSALLEALREEIAPDPRFYARLRTRIAQGGRDRAETTLLQVLGFARRLVPAMALGILLLAASLSLTGPRLPQAGLGKEIYAFSLEELNLPAAVERPSQDQMLAFVLMRDSEPDDRDAR